MFLPQLGKVNVKRGPYLSSISARNLSIPSLCLKTSSMFPMSGRPLGPGRSDLSNVPMHLLGYLAATMITKSRSAATQAKRSATMKVNIVSFEPSITSKLLGEETMSCQWYARLVHLHVPVPHVRIKYQLCGYIVSAVNLILM